MKTLTSDRISPELLKCLLMQRLPAQIQQILSVRGDNLQVLSKMTDSVFEISICDLVLSVSANFQSLDVSKFEDRLPAIENRLLRLEVRLRSFREETLRFVVLTNTNIVGGILSLVKRQTDANSHAHLNRKTS
ncbi:hypothetical protein AVEN_180752-1 [Araneus ventricosus]|uniref:Uncharacterized protein n=2 Tax=Araneus ventricosus TaxID=182803 RepID=A0A4Y2NAE2_ARAVE|nr:hypothetical protein AVEN_180752-1 [Araneus ventricosus]